MRLLSLCLFSLSSLVAQDAKEGTTGDAQKNVKIRQFVVEGTRLPSQSMLHLAGLTTGEEVNFLKLNGALQQAIKSGLIRNIDFEYESLPDRETDVILHLKVIDEKATATASISIPRVSEEEVWAWLATIDPLFTREMPPNEAAVRLYSNWIAKFMENHGDQKFQENFAIVANASSSTGGAPDRLVFKAVKRRGTK